MSDTTPHVLPPPPPGRNGCLTALMVLVGIILLLPGLCALLFGGAGIFSGRVDPGIMPFVLVGLITGAVGVALIVSAIRGS